MTTQRYVIGKDEYERLAKDAERYRWLREHPDLKCYAAYQAATLDIAVDIDMSVYAATPGRKAWT